MTSQVPPIRDPATRDEVERVKSALTLLCPGAHVNSDHAGPESAWIQRITIPLVSDIKITITSEIDGWQATTTGGHTAPNAIDHHDRQSLIEVIRDALHIAMIYRTEARRHL